MLDHAIEGAAHVAVFYRPEGLHVGRAIDALAELLMRVLVPDPPASR